MGKESKADRLSGFGRREFLTRSCRWASAGLVLRSWSGFGYPSARDQASPPQPASHPLAYFDDRLAPHYRQPTSIDEVLRKVEPGLDAFVTEKYAAEIEAVLAKWTAELCRATNQAAARFVAVENSLSATLQATSLIPNVRQPLRPTPGLSVWRSRFPTALDLNPEKFLAEFRHFAGIFSNLVTAEFKVTAISASGEAADPGSLQTSVRYDLVGTGTDFFRGERVGQWDLEWERDSAGIWRVRKWQALDETETRAAAPVFADITDRALGGCASYHQQLVPGVDQWRTVLDGASRIDVYGNNGIAVGDVDGDGFDDVYVCQPAGLPNRLYRNQGDGTFEDVTERAGVAVLDSTANALFADLMNRGRQDLIVVTVDGPLLFLNQDDGQFENKPDAFRFAQPPQGTFTGAALADYDGDGRLDIYFGLYSYYLGLNQYQYPTPYYTAENGPPNFLMHNQGDGTFADVTAASGMNVNNSRYTFTCGWTDFDGDGRPDLYVVNDFGRKNLYRNNGNGTFTDVAREAGVEDVGAGMSVCWFDYDGDGKQDLYVADMWSAAGKRVSTQDVFLKDAPAEVRALLRKHADGNSLFRNESNGRFADQSAAAGVQMGRWSWSSDAWDFDHDGYPDIYIANGMISGPDRRDLSSFFWRQVVAETPLKPVSSPRYEKGWNAINELIRADGTWSGYERNSFFANNRDGTFSEIAGAAGLDFIEDSRAFALTDLDHDGRLEVFLKNRSGPQLRVLHNELQDLGASIAFRLRGRKSNRDAIGAAITVEGGGLRQTKFIQAGSGFLSQHTKDLHFGLGKAQDPVRAIIHWPTGLVEHFEGLPVGHLIQIEEGSGQFHAVPYVHGNAAVSPARQEQGASKMAALPAGPPPTTVETWLIAPVVAPDFSLPDVAGHERKLADFRGHPLLLTFWRTPSSASDRDLAVFEQRYQHWTAQGLQLVSINVNLPGEADEARKLVSGRHYSFPILLATEEVAAVYNILYHYLFDRRRDLGIPTSFLLDSKGLIVRVYQGPVDAESVEADARQIPTTAAERLAKGLPFPGSLYGGEFHRNQFTYALVFMERGYLDQALASCQMVLEHEPENADARYLLGMIYLKKQMPKESRASFEQTLRSRPSYPDTWTNAWNNLGMLAAQEGRNDDAIAALKEALRLSPGYSVALENLGNVYRQQHRWAEAQSTLEQALASDPNDAGINYSLAMTFVQEGDTPRAEQYLEAAVNLRPDYPEALNNLGILYLRTHRIEQGVKSFETCIRVAPDFDQAYINLAKVYALEDHKDEAVDTLHQLLKRHPDHALAQQMLSELGR
ncbi:MAG TPA: FG-GAP-like repeat-containing protein [Terriglobia bacterium]|nr:FG-GAP-like repeat-containing protein [Terriglobia bacterium]